LNSRSPRKSRPTASMASQSQRGTEGSNLVPSSGSVWRTFGIPRRTPRECLGAQPRSADRLPRCGTRPLNSAIGGSADRRRSARSRVDDQVGRCRSETMPTGIMAEHLEYCGLCDGCPRPQLRQDLRIRFQRPTCLDIARIMSRNQFRPLGANKPTTVFLLAHVIRCRRHYSRPTAARPEA
jgi:hypothetical protein